MRAEVHVLTLSATPIPRTLQLAMTGVRELSIIATPPVDRLAVRTSIMPFDELIVREALLRERYRGGQSFYVCPRIEDLDEAAAFLRKSVPEVKFITAHGQMSATELEERMSAFYDGKYDVLVSTAIVESGLDIPTANTLIVYRADMFGLAQLYQLRGRVGRSKIRAYALFTLPVNRTLTAQAEKRLKVLQSLDTLGAGFQLASHDLDIRGAGNLLGDEQSGHIKEVGYELYQQMLEEAVVALKAGIEEPQEEAWSPSITVGMPVTIPEDYVEDLSVRLNLYRRLSTLETDEEIESFGAEMIDRFGPTPDEVKQLLKLMSIKALCRKAHVEKVDAGPEGRHRHVPRQFLRQSGRPRALRLGAGSARQGASGHEDRLHPRFRRRAGASRRRAPHRARAGGDCCEEGGVASAPSWSAFADHDGARREPVRTPAVAETATEAPMKALVWHGKHDIRCEAVPDPKIEQGRDAIIKVTSCAICGSDLHLYDGFMPGMQSGDIIGHEFMGEVVEVGTDNKKLKVGDRVVVPFTICCGECEQCQRGNFSVCERTQPQRARWREKMFGHTTAGLFGYTHLTGGYAGGQAEYVRVPYADVAPVKIPDGLTDDQVLFLGDIFPTGWQAAVQCDIQPDDTVADLGRGPVGQFAIRSAMLLGAKQVIAIDHVPERLDMAARRARSRSTSTRRAWSTG